MKTTITSNQIVSLLTLLSQKGITPETFQQRLESGVLADIFDKHADLTQRNKIRRSIGMFEEPNFICRSAELEAGGVIATVEVPELKDSELPIFLEQNWFAPMSPQDLAWITHTGEKKEVRIAFVRYPDGDKFIRITNWDMLIEVELPVCPAGTKLIVWEKKNPRLQKWFKS